MTFKVGDKVTFVGNKSGNVPNFFAESDGIDESLLKHGITIWNDAPCEVVGISNRYIVVKYNSPDGRTMQLGFESESLKKIGKNVKSVPIVKHLVIEDSCQNYHGIYSDYNGAVDKAKTISGATTIYKLTEVATVKSIKQVKKTPISRIKK